MLEVAVVLAIVRAVGHVGEVGPAPARCRGLPWFPLSPVVEHRRMLKVVEAVAVADTRQKVEFLRLLKLQPVQVKPSRALLRE